MIKKISLLFGITLFSIVSFAQQTVSLHLKFSELYTTYHFIQKVTHSYSQSEIKVKFEKSIYNTNEHQQLLNQFNTLALNYHYPFDQYPSQLKIPFQSENYLIRNLCTSSSITEFNEKTNGIIPDEDLQQFSAILQEFLPICKELLIEPTKKSFNKQLKEFKNYLTQHNVNELFNTGLTFYDSKWASSKFDIYVLPSIEKKSINATALFNIGICEIPMNFKHYDVLVGVLMHEIYHVLLDHQYKAVKDNWQKWFTENPLKSNKYALYLLNEAFATALGNGYVYEKLTNQLDPDDWYNITYINQIAKAIYPSVKLYCETQKSVDNTFINRYITVFDSLFKDWNNELEFVMMYRNILTDNPADFDYFVQQYPYATSSNYEVPFSLSGIERIQTNEMTSVLIISNQHQKQLTTLKNQFEELANNSFDPEKEFIYTCLLKNGLRLFIVNQHKTSLAKLFNSNFPTGKITNINLQHLK